MSKQQHSTPSEQPQQTERKVNIPKLVLAGLLLVIALIFIFSNLDKASLHFIGASLTMPGWVWFLLLLAVGVIIGSLFPWFRPRKQKSN
ncbi:MAG: hypothetical protein ACTIJJ_04105 [Galactobacter sp.]